jgi:hypothetical protein
MPTQEELICFINGVINPLIPYDIKGWNGMPH